MRNIIFAFILIAIQVHGQAPVIKQVVTTLIPQRSIYLNGGARASVGGKSRVTLKVDLPPNTKSWYYSFSTTPGESGIANLNLAIQLSALALDPTAATQAVAQSIKVPPGVASMDVYVLDEKNSDLFIQKVDNNGGQFYYFREATVANTKQAVVANDEIKAGTLYLGLKNPSMWDGMNVLIEVAALVEEYEITAEQSQAITLGNLGWKAFERGDYERCIELSTKALALYNNLGYVYFNRALAYLMQGKHDLALDEYAQAVAVTKKSPTAKDTFLGAVNDLRTYMQKFPSPADAQDILEIIELEVKAYK